VEDWLVDHPEDRRSIDHQQRLTMLWRSHAAPEPSGAAWAGVLARVQSGLAAGPRTAANRKGRTARLAWLLAALSTAAAILLAMRPLFQPNAPPAVTAAEQEAEESFAVLADDEVEIMSIQAEDTAALVVGEPPVRDPVIMASAEDISLHNIEPDADGMIPDMYSREPSGPGMLVAPLGTKD